MKDVKIVSTVQFPGGGMFRETYELTNLPPEADGELRKQFAEFKHLSDDAAKASLGKADANRVCTLDVTVDGAAQPQLSATLTRHEHEKVQKRSHKMGEEALAKLHAR